MYMRTVFLPLALSLMGLLVTAMIGCGPKQIESVPPTVSTPEPAVVEKPPLPEPYATRTVQTRSNVRTEPSPSGTIVARLEAETPVGLVTLETGWYQIVADSVVGWVWAPLVNMTENDRWDAAMSYSLAELVYDSLFVAKYRDDQAMTIILNIAWRNLSDMRKLQVVSETGEVWRRGCRHMGINPPPEVLFMSNNEVQMARWHAFWGPEVHH